MSERRRYLYQAVAGAAVFGDLKMTLADARRAVTALREAHDRRYGGAYPNAEVERVQLNNNNSRRYWRWRRGMWSTQSHYDPTPADLAKWGEQSAPETATPDRDAD